MTQRDFKNNLRIIVPVLVCIFVVLYIFYEARLVLNGPELTIFFPTNNEVVTKTLIEITGKAKNISMLTVNGRPIMITPDNLFNDKLLLLSGYNRIEIKAKDKFEQEKSEILNIFLDEPPKVQQLEKATSTLNSNNQNHGKETSSGKNILR